MKRYFNIIKTDFVNIVTSDDLVRTSEMLITTGDGFITVSATASVHANILGKLCKSFDDEELEIICI